MRAIVHIFHRLYLYLTVAAESVESLNRIEPNQAVCSLSLSSPLLSSRLLLGCPELALALGTGHWALGTGTYIGTVPR